MHGLCTVYAKTLLLVIVAHVVVIQIVVVLLIGVALDLVLDVVQPCRGFSLLFREGELLLISLFVSFPLFGIANTNS